MLEGTNKEFKELDRETKKLPESTLKEIVAFLNTDGGELLIGIRNDGTIAGVDNVDETMQALSNIIADGIKPNALPFVRIDIEEEQGKKIIKCTVSAGIERPYFLGKKGLTPEGVYIRVGSTSRNVNESAIRSMIVEASGKSYEECRSLMQNLSFKAMSKEMKKRKLSFGKPQMKILKLIGEDGLYTNLALLLSDQCPFITKVAEFDGDVFRDRQEVGGSLFEQLNDVYALLNMNNKTQADFDELVRIDTRDYPPVALREALLNSIVHRSYTFTDGNIINIRDDRTEFISLGGLAPEISYDAIFMGLSQSRNPNLATVFYRLKLIESYGTGIQKIIKGYEDYDVKPEFQTAQGVFKVVLPNVNYRKNNRAKKLPKAAPKGNIPNEIEKLLKTKESVMRRDVEKALGISSTRAFTILKRLCDEGILRQEKRGRMTVYVRED